MPSNTSSKISGGISLLAAILLGVTFGCGKANQLRAGSVRDEAIGANRTPASMPAADEDFFRDMDGGLALTRDEVKGRNMWLVWTGGNDRFWEKMTVASVGNFDLLKTISSNRNLKFSRDNRWNYLGLVNEPCFDKATGPDPN